VSEIWPKGLDDLDLIAAHEIPEDLHGELNIATDEAASIRVNQALALRRINNLRGNE
jgi:hypothetical protein